MIGRNREGWLVGNTHRQCTRCGVIYKMTSKMPFCGECNSTRVKGRDLRKKILARAKNRAKERGIPFDLVYTDIIIPEYCPILGIKLEEVKGHSGCYDQSPSLDRIVPKLGYVKGNVQVISSLANHMKASANKKQMLLFANWVLENQDNIPDSD